MARRRMKKKRTFKILSLKSYKAFCQLIKLSPSYIIVSVILSIMNSIATIINIVAIKIVLDALLVRSHFYRLLVILVAIALYTFIVTAFTSYAKNVILPKCKQNIHRKIQTSLFACVNEIDLNYIESNAFYSKYYFVLQQSESAIFVVFDTASQLIGYIISIFSLSAIIFSYDYIIIIFVIGCSVLSLLLNFVKSKYRHTINFELVEKDRKSSYILRLFYLRNFIKELKIYKMFKMLNSKNNMILDDKIKLIKKFGTKLFGLDICDGGIKNILNAFIMLYLAYMVYMLKISISDYMLVYTGSTQLSSQISNILAIFPVLYENGMYINDYFDFIEQNHRYSSLSNKKSVTPLDNKIVSINFSHVSFKYDKESNFNIDDVNFSVKCNEKLSIVGYNGAGKSTLVKLLARLYRPSYGKIEINDRNIDDINVNKYWDKMGFVFQDYQLYSFSIYENILMQNITGSNDDEQKVYRALQFVGLYDKVMKYPQNIYSIISSEFVPNGIDLSGGERQKIALARIYVKNYDVLVLDEPSSAFDPVSSAEIQELIRRLSKNKILIYISHQLSNIKDSDMIIYMRDGRITEFGTHNELLKLNGDYSEMYNIQSSRY